MRESKPLPDGRGTVFSTARANINLRINKHDLRLNDAIKTQPKVGRTGLSVLQKMGAARYDEMQRVQPDNGNKGD